MELQEDGAIAHSADLPELTDSAGRQVSGIRQSVAVSQVKGRISVGIMTDPQSLGEYEQAVPGCGSTIIDKFFHQTEREQTHRHQLEREQNENSKDYSMALVKQGDRGQVIGALVALGGFALVAFIVRCGHEIIAGTFGITEITALVSVFVYGRKKQAEEAVVAVKAESESDKLALAPKNGGSDPPTRV